MAPLESQRPPANGALLTTLAFWNPSLAGAITFMFGTSHVLVYWLATLVIADVVTLEIYAAALVVRRLVTYVCRLRGRPPPQSGGWYLLLAVVILPAALPLGFLAGAATAKSYSVSWGPTGYGTGAPSYGFSWGPDLHSYRVAIGFGLAMVMLYAFQRLRSDARERAQAAEAQVKDHETAQLQARLSALTSEMNPHLLFNALNTVASLIHTDPEQAEDVVLQLSDLYRGLLRSSGAATHDLREEITLCRAYLRLEQARFGERLQADVGVDAAIGTQPILVPILVLQPFVENAVRHGISSRARGGRVSVSVRLRAPQVELSVEDDGVGLGHSTHRGSGKSMANCRDRLSLAYGSKASLDVTDRADGGTRVVILIPIDPPFEGTAS
ncbi:MAG: histidine kinase [Polyangiaceae bacterium]